MNETVERVGEALRTACKEEFGTSWSYDVAWKFARAAIEAMREPDAAMLHAAAKAMSPNHRPPGGWVPVRVKHKIRWQAMIDASLAPAQGPDAGRMQE